MMISKINAEFELRFKIECQSVYNASFRSQHYREEQPKTINKKRYCSKLGAKKMENWTRMTYKEMLNSDDDICNDNEYQVEMDDVLNGISSE